MSCRLSVVTVCFNNLSDLKNTIASVDQQFLLPHEHIIVDGSTCKDIAAYLATARPCAYRKWISEPDEGISDAFNKGIKMASGEIIHLLNSGDCYFDETITAKVTLAFNQNPAIQWLHGKYAQNLTGRWILTGKKFDCNQLYRGMHKVGHPTMFVRKGLYEKYGLFDKSLQYAMDFDFLARIAHEPFYYLPEPLVFFTPGGLTHERRFESLNEAAQVYRRYKQPDLKLFFWSIYIRGFFKLIATKPGAKLFDLKNSKATAKKHLSDRQEQCLSKPQK